MTQFQLLLGDCLEKLKEIPDCSVDSVVTDPPYEIGFMGKAWDAAGIAFRTDVWLECLRVLKPGGHLLAFGATRTFHRMACAIEDSGFEVRDTITWLRGGQSMPKSTNVSKALDKAGAVDASRAWNGWGTALKPIQEPILVARKPLDGTIPANVLAHGVGGLNIGACRIGDAVRVNRSAGNKPGGAALHLSVRGMPAGVAPRAAVGRWPPNAVLSHSPACGDTCADGCAVAELDAQTPDLKRRGNKGPSVATIRTNVPFGPPNRNSGAEYNRDDEGGASRFFPIFRYVTKPSRRERDAGLEAAPTRDAGASMNTRCSACGQLKLDHPASRCGCAIHVPAEQTSRAGRKNHHPTVKPVALMRWLIRLVTPPGGLVLDPFTGSGTTGVAAMQEGFRFIGCEREDEYIAIARARIEAAANDRTGEQLSLLDGL